MKKIALVVDFNVSLDYKELNFEQFDLFEIDRFNGIIKNTTKNGVEINCVGLNMKEFYQFIRSNYQEIYSLLLTYSSIDINEHLLKQDLNEIRKELEAKIYVYLINYTNQAKEDIVKSTIRLIEAQYSIKDIISRISKVKSKELFSLESLIMQYFSNIHRI